jgi:aminoglycoside 6'-N-acetyltransferase
MIGRGHGAAFLQLLALRLLAAGAPLVAIDPDAENLRARKAYRKAGFHEQAIAATEEGQVAVMTFSASRDRLNE